MHPQPPGTRFARAYPSRTQNPAPSAAMAVPPSTGYTPAHTTAPAAHSSPPAAASARRQRRLVIPSARRTALASGSRRAARYSLLVPATTSRTPQLATHPARNSEAPEPIPVTGLLLLTLAAPLPSGRLGFGHHAEAEAGRVHVAQVQV